MCGILAVVSARGTATGADLLRATHLIRHRGPDDEGYLLWQKNSEPEVLAGPDTATKTRQQHGYTNLLPDSRFHVGFGHRRLSIVDLSPLGHQPMHYKKRGLAITFNGEVYNYIEIREELKQKGHQFTTASDTEVVLHAWEEWGAACLHRFNGMFAFVLLDYQRNELYAVRDRFGVKPLYYFQAGDDLYLSSEIKQIKSLPGYSFRLNTGIARQFLALGVSEHSEDTFYEGVKQLSPGHCMRISLSSPALQYSAEPWYELKPTRWRGSYNDASAHLRTLLTDAVKLRLRSDVRVGSCLSGGLDSSAIVCLAAELLKANGNYAGQETVTASFDNARYDEWNFAESVIAKTGARPHRVYPQFAGLAEDLDKIIWHQDEPIGSTSVFSQWCVFRESRKQGLTVMIDGQGADEQLAGYGGYDISLYTGLLRHLKLSSLYREASFYKKEQGHWPKGFLLGAMQIAGGPGFTALFPERMKVVKKNFVSFLSPPEPGSVYETPSASLNENLMRQVHVEPLPALLRFEDRNSMAWSIESRTPFMDYRLMEFSLGLPERFVYRQGTRKAILRSAMSGVLPDKVAARRDKMGFVTPEELWLKGEGKAWFLDGIGKAIATFGGSLLHEREAHDYVNAVVSGKRPFDFVPWRMLCFHRWYEAATK